MAGRKNKKRKSKLGMAPGAPVFTGEQKMDEPRISLIQYSADHYQEKESTSWEETLRDVRSWDGISWVNIDGLHNEDLILGIGEALGIHRLTIEDILHTGQRPKIEENEGYLFVVIKMFMKVPGLRIEDEQISIVQKDRLVVSFQERTGDVFSYVRRRLEEGKGQIRKRSSDYLLYALVDAVVDHYYPVIEALGEKLEELEETVLTDPSESALGRMHRIRREILYLRRSVYPLRELVHRFQQIENPLLHPDTKVFVRDLYDHTIQVIENIEVFRDLTSSIIDLYMNSVSNRLNNIMKVLTIIATIFIPLTFVAGVYGMNFENMPELSWHYGYHFVLAVMAVIFFAMLLYFRRKKWL